MISEEFSKNVCLNDERTGKQLIGIMGRDGTEYVLEFRVNKNGNREIWENDK